MATTMDCLPPESQVENAVAGPSTLPAEIPRPTLFLPPNPPSKPPIFFTATEDLLNTFQLQEPYHKYVTPFITPLSTSPGDVKSAVDKGKGKEVPSPIKDTPNTPAADAHDPDDDEGGGGRDRKKKSNSYKHLIKGVPGKHSMKKDDYLATIIQVPPKQTAKILPFDQKTQRDAFTVSLDGLKGWNSSTLIQESAQAREDRKKRKELKRLAKVQAQQAAASLAAGSSSPSTGTAPQNPATPASHPQPSTPSTTVPRPSQAHTPRPTNSVLGTPRPPITRPNSTKPPPVQVPAPGVRVGTPLRTGTPTIPSPLGLPPITASTDPRGKKREWSEELPATNGVNGTHTPLNGAAAALSPAAVKAAALLAGAGAGRSRPLKKQRVDQTPVQQPTPQGV